MATLKKALGTICLFVPREAIVLSFGQLLECRTYLVSAALAQDADIRFFRIHACHAPSLCKMKLISKAFFGLISFAISRTISSFLPLLLFSSFSLFHFLIFPLSFSLFPSFIFLIFRGPWAASSMNQHAQMCLCPCFFSFASLCYFFHSVIFSRLYDALSPKIPTHIHSWGLSGT